MIKLNREQAMGNGQWAMGNGHSCNGQWTLLKKEEEKNCPLVSPFPAPSAPSASPASPASRTPLRRL